MWQVFLSGREEIPLARTGSKKIEIDRGAGGERKVISDANTII